MINRLTSSLRQEPEMEGQPIWLSRTTTLGPTTLVTWLLQLAQVNQCHLQRRRKALDFEGYATFHKEQHTILEGLNEYGYAGMDEGSKTRLLLVWNQDNST